MTVRLWWCVLVVALTVAGSVQPAASQSGAAAEVELIEAASEREVAGELGESERLLRRALEARRSSVPALLALERVLRIQGRLGVLPALVERALEDDPGSALLNRLLVRTYSELDQVEPLEAAAAAWMERVPTLETAYRDVARVWESRGEYGRARSVLEEGRRRANRPDALALELGDLYATLGEPAAAVREWARSIDATGRGLSQVQRRLQALPHAGADVVEELVELLAAEGEAPGRVGAALELAVDARLEARAQVIADGYLAGLAPEERARRLHRLARRSDAAGLPALAYWAYDRLVRLEGTGDVDEGRLAALQHRRAELAREQADTGDAIGPRAAAETGASAVDAGAAGSLRIELLAAGDPGQARDALERYREANPGSPELDRLTAAVATALVDDGRDGEAIALLSRSTGPRSAQLRARLLLAAGDVSGARGAYLSAASGLRGTEATAALERVRLLGRLSGPAAAVVGQALLLQERDRAGEAVDRVTAALDGLEAADAPALLAFAADLADAAALTGDATSLRRRLVETYPRSPEAPDALLSLGRALGGADGTREEARELLERLIIEYPRSALVPEARQALRRLRADGMAREGTKG